MPDDDFDENRLEHFDSLGSKTGTKKGNALVDGLKWIIRQGKRNKRAPINLLLNTDSEPIILQIEGTVVDADAGFGFLPVEPGNIPPDIA